MFIDENIPNTYKYVAEISDNYIVLVKEPTLYNNRSYDAYYQFFNPSTQILFVDNYHLTNFDNSTYNVTYDNNGYFSYIDNISVASSFDTYQIDVERDNEALLFNRPDISNILIMVALGLALYVLIWNLASSLVHRGGIFHA